MLNFFYYFNKGGAVKNNSEIYRSLNWDRYYDFVDEVPGLRIKGGPFDVRWPSTYVGRTYKIITVNGQIFTATVNDSGQWTQDGMQWRISDGPHCESCWVVAWKLMRKNEILIPETSGSTTKFVLARDCQFKDVYYLITHLQYKTHKDLCERFEIDDIEIIDKGNIYVRIEGDQVTISFDSPHYKRSILVAEEDVLNYAKKNWLRKFNKYSVVGFS